MRSAQIRFSDHSILRVVQILGKLGNWKRVLQLIEWLQSRDRFKCHRPRYSIHNHNLLHIKAHCESYSYRFNWCEALINGIILIGNATVKKKFVLVFSWISRCFDASNWFLFSRYICTAALDALGKARRPVEALNLFYRMQV